MSYVCYQNNCGDCGFAAIKMLMANKVKNKSYLYLDKPQKKKDYSVYELVRYAKRYGFALSSYQLPSDDVRSIPNSSVVMVGLNHLVYVKRVGRHKVHVHDPFRGKEDISIKEFEKLWTGLVIECVNTKDVYKINIKKERITPLWMDVVHLAIATSIFGFLMAGFYLLRDDSSLIFTIVFLALFGIAELVENWYIIKEMKFFDKKYIPKYFSKRRNQNYKKYVAYTSYKTKYFITSKLLLSNLIVVLAFSILLCINDYRNIFAFLILLLVKVLDNKLFSKPIKDSEQTISNIETLAFETEINVIKNLEKANHLATNHALFMSLKRVIVLIISLILSVAMMFASGVVSANFVIFHLGIYFVMSESFEHIICFFSNSNDYKLREAQFLEECD